MHTTVTGPRADHGDPVYTADGVFVGRITVGWIMEGSPLLPCFTDALDPRTEIDTWVEDRWVLRLTLLAMQRRAGEQHRHAMARRKRKQATTPGGPEAALHEAELRIIERANQQAFHVIRTLRAERQGVREALGETTAAEEALIGQIERLGVAALRQNVDTALERYTEKERIP